MQADIYMDETQVAKIADIVKKLPEDAYGLNFYSFQTSDGEVVAKDMYPALNHPHAVDFFFFCVLHQHGFWYGDDTGYDEPLIGSIENKRAKGSTLLWKSMMRSFCANPLTVTPEWLHPFTPQKFAELFSDDKGPIPFPDWEARYILTKRYIAWLTETDVTPSDIIKTANESDSSLQQFRRSMKQVPGYEEDHFEKKTLLLAMALSSRPEQYLSINDPGYWMPIVDYHYMRVALRIGMVVVKNVSLKEKLTNRKWVSAEEEYAVREKTFEAVQYVLKLSGRSLSCVDYVFWSSGRFCPEFTDPDCAKCMFREPCAKDIAFFQPVFRTRNY